MAEPDIFKTDQGSHFTSLEFMDGTGCWRDNVFVERLWRSVKYEEVYLGAYEGVSAAHQYLKRYPTFYKQKRPYRALDGHTPDGVYFNNLPRAAHGSIGNIGKAPLLNQESLCKQMESPLLRMSLRMGKRREL